MMSLLKIVLLLASVAAHPNPQPATGKIAPCSEHIVELRDAPQTRWAPLINQYKAPILSVLQTIKGHIPSHILPFIEKLANPLAKLWSEPYKSEMAGIADALGVPVADVLAMNLFYELASGCTSIVARHANGTIYHGRNLDYSIPGLQNITVTVRFVNNGSTEYMGTTYVGYIGLLTGMRPSAFTVSIDERDTKNGTVWDNAMEAIFRHGHSIGFLLRTTLATAADYGSALKSLQTTHVDSPSYLVLGGAREQASVITRNRDLAVDTWSLDANEGRWFLVETNYDHWGPVPADDNRRDPANKRMNATLPEALGPKAMHDIMFQFPTLNDHTTYSTVMSSDTGHFESTIQNL